MQILFVAFTKVCQFEFSPFVDEQILGLQVSVENFPSVTVPQSSQDLVQKNLRKKYKVESQYAV